MEQVSQASDFRVIAAAKGGGTAGHQDRAITGESPANILEYDCGLGVQIPH